MSDKDTKPMTHEDYRIPSINAFNFTAWSRENIPKPPHKYKVGDFVTVTMTVEILELHRDCDGTALYRLDQLGSGQSLDSSYARPATQNEIEGM